jgi:hypothetical protein
LGLDPFQLPGDSAQAQFAQGCIEQLQGLRGVQSQVSKNRQKAAKDCRLATTHCRLSRAIQVGTTFA